MLHSKLCGCSSFASSQSKPSLLTAPLRQKLGDCCCITVQVIVALVSQQLQLQIQKQRFYPFVFNNIIKIFFHKPLVTCGRTRIGLNWKICLMVFTAWEFKHQNVCIDVAMNTVMVSLHASRSTKCLIVKGKSYCLLFQMLRTPGLSLILEGKIKRIWHFLDSGDCQVLVLFSYFIPCIQNKMLCASDSWICQFGGS